MTEKNKVRLARSAVVVVGAGCASGGGIAILQSQTSVVIFGVIMVTLGITALALGIFLNDENVKKAARSL